MYGILTPKLKVGNHKSLSRDLFLLEIEMPVHISRERGFLILRILRKDGFGDEVEDGVRGTAVNKGLIGRTWTHGIQLFHLCAQIGKKISAYEMKQSVKGCDHPLESVVQWLFEVMLRSLRGSIKKEQNIQHLSKDSDSF